MVVVVVVVVVAGEEGGACPVARPVSILSADRAAIQAAHNARENSNSLFMRTIVQVQSNLTTNPW